MTTPGTPSALVADPVDIDLGSRYRAGAGPVPLTGVQAIARLLVEQHTADAAAGLSTATFVSGYQGSPLVGLDKILAGAPELAESAGLRFVPGLNEELAATAVWGSQVEVPNHERTVDGVIGIWYGKAPGVDRAGDALRHGNLCGAHPQGGVLVLAGDDPNCKSSSIPAVSERALAAHGIPVLYPGDAAEVLRLGRYGIELSRATGLWVGMKITTDVADGVYGIDADAGHVDVVLPALEWDGRPWQPRQYPLLGPSSLPAEQEQHGPRQAMLRAFLAENPVNTVELDAENARTGIIAGGKTFTDVRQALLDLGLTDDDLRRAGIRLLRLGMIHPLEPDLIREFATGLESVLVVEEKTPFIETAVRDLLYDLAAGPVVIGALDRAGAPLVPTTGEITAATLKGPLRRVLAAHPGLTLTPDRRPPPALELLPTPRTPYFCAGCPHNRSTSVPEGAVAGGGIGCHAMVTLVHRPESEVSSLTQMGGEGAQWIGQSPFTAAPHMYQNLGDGTFAHSGQLAVQACVAAGVSITYKLLYNKAVAMTGGQEVEGGLEVPAMATKLIAEGVKKIIICADEPERYRTLAPLPTEAQLWHRDRLAEAQRALAQVRGVSVLIYDQRCAAEARRLRKRGQLTPRTTRVVINQEICEGCGDCGAKSNCLSVHPVDTELGRKTRIDQSSCNTDYSCLDGDCPSFVTVELPSGEQPRPRRTRPEPPTVPDIPRPPSARAVDVFLAGIGGTGIVTVNQLLATAALRDGLTVHGMDQTGLSQKAGPVTSHLRIDPKDTTHRPANRVGHRQADCYLAFDVLVGADSKNLDHASPEQTIAIVSTSAVPTGAMVREVSTPAPDGKAMLTRIRHATRAAVALDAQAAALALFGDTTPANLLLVGAAYQAGALPLSADSIEASIELNGVAVPMNIAAFRWGRAAVAEPQTFATATRHSQPAPPRPAASEADLPLGLDLGELAGETRRRVQLRAAKLIGYQDLATADSYVSDVLSVWRAERRLGQDTRFSTAVAEGLYKLTAYKDEYEVARLLTDPAFETQLAAEVPGARKPRYRLHPPILKALGRHKKIALGPWMRPILRALAHGKAVRGTPFDPFGRTAMRKLERSLRDEYRTLVLRLADDLETSSYDQATAAAQAADLVRGYEDVKLASIGRYQARLADLGVQLPGR
jgi:indolepyruvate ferredoxin oxidoreductase